MGTAYERARTAATIFDDHWRVMSYIGFVERYLCRGEK
jgi:hypothetical protein